MAALTVFSIDERKKINARESYKYQVQNLNWFTFGKYYTNGNEIKTRTYYRARQLLYAEYQRKMKKFYSDMCVKNISSLVRKHGYKFIVMNVKGKNGIQSNKLVDAVNSVSSDINTDNATRVILHQFNSNRAFGAFRKIRSRKYVLHAVYDSQITNVPKLPDSPYYRRIILSSPMCSDSDTEYPDDIVVDDYDLENHDTLPIDNCNLIK